MPKRQNISYARGLKFALVSIFAVLIGCSGDQVVEISATKCPPVLIPKYTESFVRYRDPVPGGGRDITDISFQAGIGYLSGECRVNPNEIIMNFPVLVEAMRGVANKNGQADMQVFLAVMNDQNERLSQSSLSYQLSFQGGNAVASLQDPVRISLPKRPDQSSDRFIIYLGFELSPEELAENRRNRP